MTCRFFISPLELTAALVAEKIRVLAATLLDMIGFRITKSQRIHKASNFEVPIRTKRQIPQRLCTIWNILWTSRVNIDSNFGVDSALELADFCPAASMAGNKIRIPAAWRSQH